MNVKGGGSKQRFSSPWFFLDLAPLSVFIAIFSLKSGPKQGQVPENCDKLHWEPVVARGEKTPTALLPLRSVDGLRLSTPTNPQGAPPVGW